MTSKFTPEQTKKIKECKTMEELKKLVQTEDIELTEEEMSEVTGGASVSAGVQMSNMFRCPKCGKESSIDFLVCPSCGWRAGGNASPDALTREKYLREQVETGRSLKD